MTTLLAPAPPSTARSTDLAPSTVDHDPIASATPSASAEPTATSGRVVRPGVRRFYDVMARRDPGLAFLNYGWAPPGALDAPPHPEPDLEMALFSSALYRRTLGVLRHPGALCGKTVVEAGCGRGGGALELVARARPDHYTGFDLSPESLRLARGRLAQTGASNTRFALADAEELPLRPESIDVILSVEAIHHFPHPRRFFATARRVLRPGGVLVLAGLFSDVDQTRSDLVAAGFSLEDEDDLTPGVLRSLTRTSARRRERVEALPLPRRFLPFLLSWAGVDTEPVFRNFERGALRYVRFRLRRP